MRKCGVKMSKHKKWIMPDTDTNKAQRMSEELNVSLLVAKILCTRSYGYDEAKGFLTRDEFNFHNPFLLNDMQKAVDRINLALKSKEKIAVYGDYDVDGITATYILYDYLKKNGANVIYYIPDRYTEGYGINEDAIDTLSEQNVGLIITVDVGITAFLETQYAKEKGIDLVITDHHSLKDELPSAVAVVNPKITKADYPFDALAGVGVAFKLIYALSGLDNKVFENYCDIAAIGTIADMVSLTGENRFIAYHGIEKLKNTQNKGISAILQLAGLNQKEVSSLDISFGIAPRINAAGRMSDASLSVELLLEDDLKSAFKKAEMLDNFNQSRQKEEQMIFDEAIKIIESNSYQNDDFILVAKEGWAHGIIGIVSSKITEKYYKPSAVVSINPDGTGKASGRSIKGINLFEILDFCSDKLVKFGGHELAAGFTVDKGKIEEMRLCAKNRVSDLMTEEISIPTLNIDCKLQLDDINLENAHSLEVLEPYGIDNTVPLFCVEDVEIKSIRYTQNKKHAFITVSNGKATREFPAFSMASDIKEFEVGDFVSVAGILGINTFKGHTSAQFIVRDIKESKLNCFVTTDELREIFKSIRSKLSESTTLFSLSDTLSVYKRKTLKVSSEKFKIAVKILSELNILISERAIDGYAIKKGENFSIKTDLNNSPTFREYNLDNIMQRGE